MSPALDDSPDLAAELCKDAFARLATTASAISDSDVRSPSRLPAWTIGHVLTHLARNADGVARRLQGSLLGQDLAKYPGGDAQRAQGIEQGASRAAADIVDDLSTSQARLEAIFDECAAARWPNPHFLGGSGYGPRACPAHRLREIEMHHVDLGLGYAPTSWSPEYVAWELPVLLDTVDARLRSPDDRRDLVAWLAGRGPFPTGATLAPWE